MASSWLSIIKNGYGFKRLHSVQKRFLHRGNFTKTEIQRRRAELFDKEALRQKSLIRNIDKITVEYEGAPESCTLVMNKEMSSPYDCSMHVSSNISDQCALAEVDGEIWDMHRPLDKDCTLRFLHFQMPDPFYVNKAFWRSMSLLLGHILETSFKHSIDLEICSFPPPSVRSGSFVYDVSMNKEEWNPTKPELISLSAKFMKLAMKKLPYNLLEVKEEVALDIFKYNPFKCSQIPSVVAQSKNRKTVPLCKIGDFVDISVGPFINDTRHIGKVSIAGAHKLDIEGYNIFRFQGVAIPKCILINHFAYKIIQERAARFNSSRIPVIENKELMEIAN